MRLTVRRSDGVYLEAGAVHGQRQRKNQKGPRPLLWHRASLAKYDLPDKGKWTFRHSRTSIVSALPGEYFGFSTHDRLTHQFMCRPRALRVRQTDLDRYRTDQRPRRRVLTLESVAAVFSRAAVTGIFLVSSGSNAVPLLGEHDIAKSRPPLTCAFLNAGRCAPHRSAAGKDATRPARTKPSKQAGTRADACSTSGIAVRQVGPLPITRTEIYLPSLEAHRTSHRGVRAGPSTAHFGRHVVMSMVLPYHGARW
jgi:hypothetical protein